MAVTVGIWLRLGSELGVVGYCIWTKIETVLVTNFIKR